MFGINLKQYKQFLTKNERNKVYLRKNSAEGRGIADSKYKTKKMIITKKTNFEFANSIFDPADHFFNNH